MPKPKKGENPEHLKPYQWKPGQSGNPAGRPKTIASRLRALLHTKDGEEKLNKALGHLLENAAKGDEQSLKWLRELMDRLDGKPAQSVLLGQDEDAGPLEIKVVDG